MSPAASVAQTAQQVGQAVALYAVKKSAEQQEQNLTLVTDAVKSVEQAHEDNKGRRVDVYG